MVNRIQVALANRREADELRKVLLKTCSLNVEIAAEPDPAYEGVLVVDTSRLELLEDTLAHPERTVVVAYRGDE